MKRSTSRWLGPAGSIAAGYTALCCIGVAAATSLATSVGATFMTRDSTLRPLLLVTLAVTTMGSTLTFWRHRNPVPLLVTVVAGVWIYSLVYILDSGGGHGGHGSNGDEGFSFERRSLVWLGLAALVLAQVWDFAWVRRQRTAERPLATGDLGPTSPPAEEPTNP